MAFTSGDQQRSIGIDVMKVRMPGRESFTSFVEIVGDQVGHFIMYALCRLEREHEPVN